MFQTQRQERRFDNTGTHQIDVEIAETPGSSRAYADKAWHVIGGWYFNAKGGSATLLDENTLIPLDIIFLDEYWNVVGIVANATPLSMTSRGVETPSKYVLELNAGESERYDVCGTGCPVYCPMSPTFD